MNNCTILSTREKIKMKGLISIILLAFFVGLFFHGSHAWGVDGHYAICSIAQDRLDTAAAAAVKDLLPKGAEGNLASYCAWADRVRFHYHWSAPLHFINTPEVCNYNYERDCKDEAGLKDRCVAGAINNYTSQLLTYNGGTNRAGEHNLTEALLFLSHFVGDIHQPLHCGYADDKGGNTINVHWYRRKAVLHHIWDVNIIETAEKDFYNEQLDGYIEAIKQNITRAWSDEVKTWETCATDQKACPDKYASESIIAACQWAYKDVKEDSTLADEYFNSRLPVLTKRLAQGGVRLAATLNRIFGN